MLNYTANLSDLGNSLLFLRNTTKYKGKCIEKNSVWTIGGDLQYELP